jgi:hypothetical protein
MHISNHFYRCSEEAVNSCILVYELCPFIGFLQTPNSTPSTPPLMPHSSK